MKNISVILPCFNEQENIRSMYDSLKEVIMKEKDYLWQIIIVDDGSTDDTPLIARHLHDDDNRIKLISLSRNFGKENALLAGLDHVDGDCAVIMDADLQHPPHVISRMLRCWEEGYEDIYAERNDRGRESIMRRWLTRIYYRLLQKLSKTDVLPNVGDFRLLDRKCVDALTQLRETQRYTKGLYCWIGFRKKSVVFDQGSRTCGKSSFNYSRLINLALEGITSYTTVPLRLSAVMGLIVSFTAFVYMCYIMVKTIVVGEPVQGFPTLMTAILFLGGIQLISVGIVGEYLSRVFNETKNRPPYIVREVVGE